MRELFDAMDKKISPANKYKRIEIDDLWNLGEEEIWFQNPGGIPGVILSRSPRYMIIPAETSCDDISSTSGALSKTLLELFEDVRSQSKNYQEAQKYSSMFPIEFSVIIWSHRI